MCLSIPNGFEVPLNQCIESYNRIIMTVNVIMDVLLCLRPLVVEALCFRVVRPSVHGCVRASVRNTSSLTRLQLNGLTDFYQTLQKCSAPSVDELIRFWQGSNKRWPTGVHLFVCLQHKLVSTISSV